MKRFLVYLAAGFLLIAGCTEMNVLDDQALPSFENQDGRPCVSMDLLQAQLQSNPKLKEKMESIEAHTVMATRNARLNALGQIEIPVFVNVLYYYADTVENITLNRIQSQIDALNHDFNATNADVINTPSLFTSLVADLDIQFVLAGVNRRQTKKYSWRTDDAMKSSKKGGIDPTNPTEYLNIWLVPQLLRRNQGIMGYAQFPGGNPATDGVVITTAFFGTIGQVAHQFNKGRTTTHEVGHWMNIHDIWGVGTCGDDFVGDTPQANTCNFGCPVFPHYSTCTGTPVEMTMNFMDLTDDACKYMFTQGQKSRALAVFIAGGPRASFAD
jgi:hypothetical protein